jgi:hypothetical protein
MENKKSKQEMIEYANFLVEQHSNLKLTIETILVEHSNTLNKANENLKITVDSIISEMEMIQTQYNSIIEELKKG